MTNTTDVYNILNLFLVFIIGCRGHFHDLYVLKAVKNPLSFIGLV